MLRQLCSLLALLALVAPTTSSAESRALFLLDAEATGTPLQIQGRSNSVVDLVEDFIKATGDFSPIGGIPSGYSGRLDYLGIPDAITLEVNQFGTQLTLDIPSTGAHVELSASNPNALLDALEDWVREAGAGEWSDFLREANALTPLAVTSGNPKSTTALLADSAYRKFGFDDSRSRLGYETKGQRWGAFELRLDVGGSTVNTGTFDDDLYSADAALTLAGDFNSLIGLSFSVIGQYRNYDGGEIADLGLELALPFTILRPTGNKSWYWQLTPVIQAGVGASIDLAAGGLMVGGGLVSGLAYNMGPFELLMANEILYYGGIPVHNISGYDFDTELDQLFFKNGLEGTWFPGAGFYADLGMHFANFLLDDAAIDFYFTPSVGVGWQAGRWMDVRLAYEADLDGKHYVSHNLQFKLDFFF